MNFSRLVSVIFITALLASCAGVDRTLPDSDAVPETQSPFLAWQIDTAQQSQPVKQLVTRADEKMRQSDLASAEVILERALRINNRIATVWSRLAWLAVEQQQYQRAQNLIIKSNSLNTDSQLQLFNWRMYRDASDYRNDAEGVALANRQLYQLGDR